jgi:transcriptional regulator with XRE-family HTH domain
MADSVHPMRAWRERNGKTLDEIAEAAKTTKSWLSRIENGEAPSNKLLRRLLTLCRGLTADDFVGAVK